MECTNPRCCRGKFHPGEDLKDASFICRNCKAKITQQNLGAIGGCSMCGPCAAGMKRCGHCGRPVA